MATMIYSGEQTKVKEILTNKKPAVTSLLC